MSLKARITEDMKSAMRAGERDRLSCIRTLQAGVKQREVEERIALLKRRIESLKNDPVTLDRVARESLGLVRPEDVVIVLPARPPAVTPPVPPQ